MITHQDDLKDEDRQRERGKGGGGVQLDESVWTADIQHTSN